MLDVRTILTCARPMGPIERIVMRRVLRFIRTATPPDLDHLAQKLRIAFGSEAEMALARRVFAEMATRLRD